jgi:CHAD domain-containing protein
MARRTPKALGYGTGLHAQFQFMPFVNSLPDAPAEKGFGFDVWMERALERAKSVRKDWDDDAVHDLRVALRRCRTMAEALEEIEPDSGWQKVKKESRELFDALGELRDAQVERSWVKRMAPRGDAMRKHVIRVLSRREREGRAQAARALDRFDVKGWRKLSRKLMPDAPQFPPQSIVFGRLALERLDQAMELYRRARKGRSAVGWHRLRIGMKRFRYVAENFLPQRYELWAADLKFIQDALGDVHDLDVLRIDLRRQCSDIEEGAMAALLAKIGQERTARLNEFRARVEEPNSPWHAWRAELPFGSAPKAAPALKSAAAYA